MLAPRSGADNPLVRRDEPGPEPEMGKGLAPSRLRARSRLLRARVSPWELDLS